MQRLGCLNIPVFFTSYILNKTSNIPIHKNGPRAITDFLSAFFLMSKYRTYPPAHSTPASKACHTPAAPNKNPPAAISLISPPPILPGMKYVSKRSGTLTTNIPIILCNRFISGKIHMLIIPVNIIPAVYLSGIRFDFQSVHAIINNSPVVNNLKIISSISDTPF